MKRIITLALAACMVLGAAFGANATEIKAKGSFAVTYDSVQTKNNSGYTLFRQRFQPQIDFIASENLSATVQFRIQQNWGDQSNNQTGLIQTRRAFMTFDLPNAPVTVTAGLQGLALPDSGWGSIIIADNTYAATVAYTPVENISVTGIFARLLDGNLTPTGKQRNDLFGLVVSADFDVVTFQPYFAYADYNTSNAAVPTKPVRTYWTGLVTSANVAGFDLSAEAVYGTANKSTVATNGAVKPNQDGWFLSATGSYTLDFAKVGVTGWYSSVRNSKNMIPSVSNGDDFGPLILFGGGLAQVFPSTESKFTTLGTSGVALTAQDISFIEKLSHGFAVGYLKADNNLSTGYNGETLNASVFEIDFISSYALYEQLDLLFDFAYANINNKDKNVKDESILRFGAGVQYNF